MRLRHFFIKGMMVLETRGDVKSGLARAFLLEDAIRHVVNERAMVSGEGVHPKHRLMQYHKFFYDRIAPGESVLDIGCSYGEVARSVAAACPNSVVMGIDYDQKKLDQARENPHNPPNLHFTFGDATLWVPNGPWLVIILSNVLEHISQRVEFLQKLQETTKCRKILIRVPYFERDWSIPMRRELGINYYSDDDHKIEHDQTEFADEMARAGLKIDEVIYRWGEIWATVQPQAA